MACVRVLHVDDEPDIRDVVEKALSLDPSIAVRSCASGQDALAVTVDWSPDIILLDVAMPEMNGPVTLSHLSKRSDTAHIPVVFLTARAQTKDVQHLMSLGAAGVITKPFNPMVLAGLVRRYQQPVLQRVDGAQKPQSTTGRKGRAVTGEAHVRGLKIRAQELEGLRQENRQLREIVIQLTRLVIKRVVEQSNQSIKSEVV